MAKKRKRSRKRAKCPEPFNTLIDIAGGVAMGVVANRMEKKYHYTAKGKINPYTVSAMGIASGRVHSTEDILKTGAILGAMGSFDVEADDVSPVFRRMEKVNDNRYAWRMNCSDGSAYGVSPYHYETREAYEKALNTAKAGNVEAGNTEAAVTRAAAPAAETSPDDEPMYLYCRVSRLDNGINEYYLCAKQEVKVGDTVCVPTEVGTTDGIVIAVERHTADDAPKPPENTQWIIENGSYK
jgi:hypothetical protein